MQDYAGNFKTDRRRQSDRRKGPDFWAKAIRYFAVAGWFVMLIALIILAIAKPDTVTYFDRINKIRLREIWNFNLTTIIFYLMIAGLFLSIFGIWTNLKRSRRKDDEYRVSLIILGLISLLGLIVYLFTF